MAGHGITFTGKFTIAYTITIIGNWFANAAADIKAKRFWCGGGRVVLGDAKSLALVNRRKLCFFTLHDKFCYAVVEQFRATAVRQHCYRY